MPPSYLSLAARQLATLDVTLADRLARHLVNAPGAPSGLVHMTALDPAALDAPDRALSCAMREVIRIGETVETMLRPVQKLFEHWDEAGAQAVTDSAESVPLILWVGERFLNEASERRARARLTIPIVNHPNIC